MLNLQERNIRKTIQDMAVGEKFLNLTPIAQGLGQYLLRVECMKLKGFYIASHNIKEIEPVYMYIKANG